jgi:hypothetical protein
MFSYLRGAQMMMQDKMVVFMIIINMIFFSYGSSDQQEMLSVIAKTPFEQELVTTGRYDLFKVVHKLYNMLEPRFVMNSNRRIIPEFKKNAGLEIYLVFDDYHITNPADLCMPWGRIRFSRVYTAKEKQRIGSLLRESLKVRHRSFFQNFACYQVLEIENKPLPAQMERVNESERSLEDIKKEWSVLSFMYGHEHSRSWLNQYKEFYALKSKEMYETQDSD